MNGRPPIYREQTLLPSIVAREVSARPAQQRDGHLLEQFDHIAADPARRQTGITGLSSRRKLMFWCAVGMTLCALVTFFMSLRSARPGGAAVVFAAAVEWMLFFKLESDLRLLRVVERLHSRSVSPSSTIRSSIV
jgi:hypothetical protein